MNNGMIVPLKIGALNDRFGKKIFYIGVSRKDMHI